MAMENFISDVSKNQFPENEKVSAKLIRKSIVSLIRQDVPDFPSDGVLSINELNFYREKYISEYLLKKSDNYLT